MTSNRIRHMVIFNLKYNPNDPETEKFLKDGERILTSIPVVEKFEVMRQVSAKNEYHFGFSMEFADQMAYDTYNQHPSHVGFVNESWLPEVIKFQEIDFKDL
jgi:hypothetical protein